MAGSVTLSESELSGLTDLSSGKISGAAAASGPLASLVERGLAKLEDDDIEFTEEMEDAFQALATCHYNLMLMDSEGNAIDQYYVGDENAAARVALVDGGMSFETVEPEKFVAGVTARVTGHLEGAKPAALPNPENFDEAMAVLGYEGLKPLGWCGLLITTDFAGTAPEDAYAEWVLVARCEPGLVWQNTDRNMLAMVNTEEELAGLIWTLLPDT